MDIFKKNQRRIALSTLRMTPATARIAGGMTFEDAYDVVYGENLVQRLQLLIKEYGKNPLNLSWELQKYGWGSPFELLCAINLSRSE